MSSIERLIKSPIGDVFATAEIKRRNSVTGLFETDWYDVTEYVKKFGSVTTKIDDARLNKFSFGNAKLVCSNEDGSFSPHTDESSLWYGYLNQQRSLVRLSAGYYYRLKRSDGVWRNISFPNAALWDDATWDINLWDASDTTSMFIGVVSGDIPLGDNNEVTFNLRPLVSVLQDYPARNLTGWTSTGMTASQFVTMVMNQTDGSSNYIFLPFFGNTTTYWDISTTTNVYSNLNTSTAAGVLDKTVWEVIEKLAEAENYIPYITRDGYFKFVSRTPNTTTVSYEFHGAGSFNSTYGHTIKKVNSFGPKLSKFYSRVEVKFIDSDTATSYVVSEGSFTVSPNSSAWVLGVRTLKVENFFIPNTSTASTISTALFNEYSALKNEIDFTTSFVPHLDLLDRITLYYDPSEFNINSLWDQRNWAEDVTSSADDLIFDAAGGDPIVLNGEEFKFLSIQIDLDKFECKYLARET